VRGGANIQVKNYSGVIHTAMEEILLDSEKERQRLLAELKKFDVVPQATGSLAVDNAVLRQYLDKLEKIYDPANLNRKADRISGPFEWYTDVAADLVFKTTLASVLFFASFPWAALWWPPFYIYYRHSKSKQ